MGCPEQSGQGLSWALVDCGEHLAHMFRMNSDPPVVFPHHLLCRAVQGEVAAVL